MIKYTYFTRLVIIALLVRVLIHRVVTFNHIDSFRQTLTQMSKKDVEIVIASYGEDITWLTEFRKFTTIYEKKQSNSNSTFHRVILPNVGRESHSYIYHIVNNYHNLANVTVFLQANRPTFGYKTLIPNQRDGGHFYCP